MNCTLQSLSLQTLGGAKVRAADEEQEKQMAQVRRIEEARARSSLAILGGSMKTGPLLLWCLVQSVRIARSWNLQTSLVLLTWLPSSLMLLVTVLQGNVGGNGSGAAGKRHWRRLRSSAPQTPQHQLRDASHPHHRPDTQPYA